MGVDVAKEDKEPEHLSGEEDPVEDQNDNSRLLS